MKEKETLEEAAERFRSNNPGTMQGGNNTKILNAFIAGAKWQQDQDKNKYSEEDMWEAYKAADSIFYDINALKLEFEKWLNNLKRNKI
jgi:hypothetical protein